MTNIYARTGNRDYWVDYAKAIGITLVVYGHVARGVSSAALPIDEGNFALIDSLIYSFHMPLFFFLAGVFFHNSLSRHGWSDFIFSKIRTIAYPYIVWSLLQGSLELILSRYTNGNVTTTEVLSLLWEPRAQFWFLYAIFIIFSACSLIYKPIDRKNYLIPVFVFSFVFIFNENISSNKLINFFTENVFFFSLGVWFYEKIDFFKTKSKKLLPAFALMFIAGQYLLHIYYGLDYRIGGWPILILAIVSIFFIVTTSMTISQLRISPILYIGQSSMAIYLMHILAGSGTRVILQKFGGITSVPFHLLAGTVAGIVLPLITLFIINRYGLHYFLTLPSNKPTLH